MYLDPAIAGKVVGGLVRGTAQAQPGPAIELVSEANKDREENRRAFAVKCGSYLQKGVALVVVD